MTDSNDIQQPDELSLLKDRAKKMGIKFHPSIGLEKLRDKVNRVINSQEASTQITEEADTPVVKAVKPETKAQREARMRKEASKLVRVKINCMNPNKTEYEGEIFTVSNSIVGTFKKYVSYNNEEGWHIPQIILKHLQERKCQVFYTVKGPRGEKVRKGKLISEFAIEIMPPLTTQELKELAQRQAMANNID